MTQDHSIDENILRLEAQNNRLRMHFERMTPTIDHTCDEGLLWKKIEGNRSQDSECSLPFWLNEYQF